MCEWLAYGDWCDVRLVCGGRFFNAHRAVLASVSSFLRGLLLSCPVDESPVFIFLPEFDLEGMSSILYYIYNGEVLIPRHKLKMFLDIAIAMEIFIDQQFLPQTDDCKQYSFEPKTNDEHNDDNNDENNDDIEESYNICQLTLLNGENGCIVKIRKDMRSEELTREKQQPIAGLKTYDKSIQAFRWSEENIPDLGNLASASRFRQRQSFLRDIFIETYSHEDNANGQTPGVLAITNEEYHIPTSALISNAVEDYSSEHKIYLHKPKKILAQNYSNSAIYDSLKEVHDVNNKEKRRGNISISYSIYNRMENDFNAECIRYKKSSSKKERNINSGKKGTPLELISFPLPRNSSMFSIESINSLLNLGHTKATSTSVKFCSEIPKVTIMNEVLQSPWHPRQPYSYRPIPKKDIYSTYIENNNENKLSNICNDNNNNSDTLIKTQYVEVTEEVTSSEHQDLRCVVCKEVFSRKQDYTIHMRRHSSMNRYSCGECHKTFSQLRNFKYHMSVHRGTKEFAATCSVCGKHFNDRGYLSNHMKIHRNRKEYKCASCPKSFNQRVAFNMHIRIHTGVKPHVCEECGKAFSRKMLLKQHQRTHSGERPYACAHCDKRFADRSNMTLHLRLHTGIKPFSCTLCSKSFTKKHHLKSHLNFHTGAKPYSCPRCQLAFTQSSNMRTHYKKCNATN